MFHELGMSISRAGDFIEKVNINGLDVALIGGGQGTEIIHHHIAKGVNWYIGPVGNWKGFEYIFILSGELACNSTQGQVVLRQHDSLSVSVVKEIIQFTALEDAEFVYFSSEPVFHNYSNQIKELIHLSVIVEEKDGNTSEHCKRIRDLSLLVGHEMKLSPQEINRLHFGSFFHDIGKAQIPDEILGKPYKFSHEEYEIMKTHAVLGKQMLFDTGNPLLIESSTIVEQHHERFDGSGYPFGLKGDEISIGAAIVAVVDSYDAMVSNRIYRKGRSKEVATEEIEHCRGILYYPLVVDSFLKIIDDVNE